MSEPIQAEVEQAAQELLTGSASPEEARQTAYRRAMRENPPNSPGRIYWLRVYETIIALSPDIQF